MYRHEGQSVSIALGFCLACMQHSVQYIFHFDRERHWFWDQPWTDYSFLKSQGNWLIMFPLSQSMPGISSRCSVISKLARRITKNNLTQRHGTLIVSVPGHEVRQDTATFMLRLTLMNIIIDAVGPRSALTERMCEPNCNPLQFGQPGTSLKQLFLMNPQILRINSHQ